MPRSIVGRLHAALLVVGALVAVTLLSGPAHAQSDVRSPLPAPVKVKQGMTNVPALSPLWLLPDYAAKYNVQIEMVMFQRFADARTALASGDLDITAFGPQDISLALGQGAKSMVGVAGVGSGNDCLIVRKGDDIKDWKALKGKAIGVGAGSISWLKFAASAQENGVEYSSLKVVNIMGGGGNYLKALQAKEIDMAVVWQPFCAQGIVDGIAQYPTHRPQQVQDGRRADLGAGGQPALHGEEPRRDAAAGRGLPRRAQVAQADRAKWSKIYAEKAGLPEPVAAESIRITQLDADPAARIDQAHLEVPLRQRRHRARRLGRDRAVLQLRFPAQGDRQVAGGPWPEPVTAWPMRRDAGGPRASAGASRGRCSCRWRSSRCGRSPSIGTGSSRGSSPRPCRWCGPGTGGSSACPRARCRPTRAPGSPPSSTPRAASCRAFSSPALVGIPLGLFVGWNRLAARLVDPSIQLLRPVPITAWLPFAIAVFGIYDASALFLIGLGAFYPIVVNTTHGVRDTNLLLLRAARMMGAGERDHPDQGRASARRCRRSSPGCAWASASPGRR